MSGQESGLDHGPIVRFGRLALATRPPAAFWDGSYLADVTQGEVRLLTALARTGKASLFELHMTTPRSVDPSAVKVQLCKLRRRLPRGLEVRSIRGWGYELISEGEVA